MSDFLRGKWRVWKQHKSKWSEAVWTNAVSKQERSPHPQHSLALGTPQPSPGRGDKGLILFPPRLAPVQMTSSCSRCLWDISSAPSPRHQTKKNMLTGLAHRHFFWPGSREEGDLFVWEIRTKCQVAVIYGRDGQKKVETASLPKPSCPGKQGSRGLTKSPEPFLVVHAWDPHALEAGAGESRVGGQPGPHARSYKIG